MSASLRRNSFVRFAAVGLVCVASFAEAATITVTSAADSVAADGAVTFREALLSINRGVDVNSDIAAHRSGTYGTSDALRFAIGSGAQTIHASSPLPAMLKPLQIDGTSQPGYVDVPLITLDGTFAGTQGNGLVIAEHTGSAVAALTVMHFVNDGVWISTRIFTGSFDLPQPADLSSRPVQTHGALEAQLRSAVRGQRPRPSTVQTSAATNILSGVVSTANGRVGVRADGALEATAVEVSSNGGDGVWVDSALPVSFTDSDIHGNGRNGIRVLRDSDSVGFTLNVASGESKVQNNLGNGIVLGDTLAQTGTVNALILDSAIDGNQIGILLEQRDVVAAATRATIASNIIHVNRGAGVYAKGASFRSAVIGATFVVPFSGNVVEHNGFPAGDNTCSNNETAAQLVFDGPTGVSSAIAAECSGAATQPQCVAAPSGYCVWVSDVSGCKPAYLVNAIGDCSQSNIITGYAAGTVTGPDVAGVTALNNATVNASVNGWKTSAPTAQDDFWVSAGSAIFPGAHCSPQNQCLP